MRKFFIFFSVLFFALTSIAQELNCKVVVNADQLVGSNMQIFKTLETSVNEFINQRHWTDKVFKPQERIDCSMVITLVKQTGNNSYSGNIQIQSSRPVFNSIYTTPLFNYKDENLNFTYTEFEPLRFDVNTYQSDLVSTLSYYVYLILALDADSFSMYGGDAYYKICQKITDQVENPNAKKGWQSNTSKINRYQLLNKLTAPANKQYRRTLYSYHINGLDKMESDKKTAKDAILKSIIALKNIYNNSMSTYIFRVFMDAKADEIVQIFNGGPQVDTKNLVEILNKISPTNAGKWAKIK
jgi:hypothetical protein